VSADHRSEIPSIGGCIGAGGLVEAHGDHIRSSPGSGVTERAQPITRRGKSAPASLWRHERKATTWPEGGCGLSPCSNPPHGQQLPHDTSTATRLADGNREGRWAAARL
jgi:hypothetical protein